MRRALQLSALLATIAASTACGGDAAETTDGSPAATPAVASARAGAGADAELAEISAHRLSMGDVERWYQAQRNVLLAMRDDPSIRERLEMAEDEDQMSLDEMERRYAEVPAIRRGIESAGLETREFAVIAWALAHASLANVALDAGASRDSVITRTGVSGANLDFVRENRAALERMQGEIAALSGADDGDDEDDEDL